MSDDPELFDQINNAVLDLQTAEFQSYERPLRRLVTLLRHEALANINQRLTDGLDLDGFLNESFATQGGMIGSARLAWPDEPKKVLGLTLLLVKRFADSPEWIQDFGHTYYYTGRKIMGDVRAVVSQLIIPCVRDYRSYVVRQGRITPVMRTPAPRKVFIVHGHDHQAL